MATYKLWKIVKAGWHADGLDSNDNLVSLSTYDTAYEPTPAQCLFSQDAWVVDARGMSEEQAIDASLNGPMVDLLLDPGQFRHYYYNKTEQAVPNQKFTALQYVSLDLIVAYWRQFPEVRIGRIKRNKVIWEDRGCKVLL
jgi:hypothetical protein